MALNKTVFLLKEGVLKEGTVLNPELIGIDGNTPLSHFTVTTLGYFKQGSITVNLPKEFADFKAGTPYQMIRQDLTGKQLQISGELGQWDGTNIAKIKNLYAQLSYAAGGETHDLLHIGNDEPTQTERAIVIEAQLVNGNPFNIMIYAGLFKQEDDSITLPGTEHAIQPFTITAFPHDGFADTAFDQQKNYGMIDIQTA